MSNGIRWTEEDVAEYLKRFDEEAMREYYERFPKGGKAQAEIGAALPIADRESVGRDASKEKVEGKEAHSRFRIVIHSKCRRLTDSGGRRGKAAVDGLVVGGLLGDDNPAWIPNQPQQTQEKSEVEETIIEIYELDETTAAIP